jgi:hypothetical protein
MNHPFTSLGLSLTALMLITCIGCSSSEDESNHQSRKSPKEEISTRAAEIKQKSKLALEDAAELTRKKSAEIAEKSAEALDKTGEALEETTETVIDEAKDVGEKTAEKTKDVIEELKE